MILHQDKDYKIEIDKPWVIVNDKPFGFMMLSDEGVRYLVIHRRSVGRLGKEHGFYVPYPLAKMRMIFETRSRNGRHVHYTYNPDKKQRLIKTAPDLFLALTRMEITEDAAHIVKPRRYKA